MKVSARPVSGVPAEEKAPRSARRLPAKFRAPRLPDDYVVRPRLLERLDDAFARRLTTIVAGPGFGKSTLLAAWARKRGARWYTVDRREDTLPRFARGLSAALDLGVVPELDGEGGDERGRADPLAGVLCEALDSRLEGDLALVLDDVHELRPRSPSARLLESFCRQAPPELHLVLCSRAKPPFAIERLRGRGDVLELDAPALAFTVDEVAAWIGEGGIVEPLYRLTEGWPAAVRLAVDSLRGTPETAWSSRLDGLAAPEGPLFPYLADEVFARGPPSVRRLLRTVAPIDRFSPDLCEALGVPRATATLARLRERGLFVHTEDDGSYTLHALVREFALERWPLTEEELRAIQLEAAGWYERTGEVEEALRLAGAASASASVARLLREHGAELDAHGAAENVLRAAAVLDPEDRDLAVELVVGKAHSLKGQWDEAAECYARVAGDAEELPAALAWRIGQIHRDRGEDAQAIAAYERGRLDGSDPVSEAHLLAWSSLAHWRRMNYEAAQEFGERALDAGRECGDERAQATAHYALALIALGRDARVSAEHARKALELAEHAGDVLQTVRCRVMAAVPGPAVEAIELIEPAIRLAEVAGADIYLADALYGRGFHRYDLGQLDAAAADYERARSIFERLGSMRVCRPLVALGGVFLERGDLALARATFEQALTLLEQAPDGPFFIWAKGGIARAIVADDPERATMLAEEAVELRGSFPTELASSLLMLGWVVLAHGDREKAAGLAAQAAEADPPAWAFPETLELQALASSDPALLVEAAALWRELQNPLATAKAEYAIARLSDPPDERGAARAKRKLRGLGVRDSAAGAAGLLMALGPERPPPLTIQVLGEFRVLRGGVAVPASEWRSKKARGLLKLLVAAHGRAVPRDALMEVLWPDDDPKKTGNRLSVALSTVRTILDPGHVHPPDWYLRGAGDTVALDLGRVVVDAEGFLAEAAAGLSAVGAGRREEAVELLEAAEASYAGDFLTEDLYEDWASTPREELRSTYVQVARSLASLTDEPRTSARYLRRVLERDPHDEQTHLDLVAALAAGRAQGEARRAYRAYVTRMEEIGIEPAPFPV